ncbi:hypothetical protein MB02_11550 [Croceicoccus estronivorus]|nr:hypothetical protein MB02_11550 [Croceicoccus estronivorus]
MVLGVQVKGLGVLMALSDTKARKAQPAERDYKLGDSGGLFLLVRPGGSKLWRMKYRFVGKEKLLSFGPYPERCATSHHHHGLSFPFLSARHG